MFTAKKKKKECIMEFITYEEGKVYGNNIT